MNLHQIVSGAIGTINPPIPVVIRISTGNTTNSDGTRTPNYASPITVSGQVQELSAKELHQTDGLNLAGVNRSLYINGTIDGVTRVTLKGGDIIILPDGTVWLVVSVPESWPDWSRAVITLQDDSSAVSLLQALQSQTY